MGYIATEKLSFNRLIITHDIIAEGQSVSIAASTYSERTSTRVCVK